MMKEERKRGTTWYSIYRKHCRSSKTMTMRNVPRTFGIGHHSLLGGFPRFAILFPRIHSQADTHAEQNATRSAKVGHTRERDLIFVFDIFEQTCIHASSTWSNVVRRIMYLISREQNGEKNFYTTTNNQLISWKQKNNQSLISSASNLEVFSKVSDEICVIPPIVANHHAEI